MIVPINGNTALVGLLQRVQRGADTALSVEIPPHARDLHWVFLCDCGYTWRADGDMVREAGELVAPKACCVSCHGWVRGRQESA